MFLDDQSIEYKTIDHYILKENVIKQAASMLLQHITLQKNIYRITHNSNGNAFDEYYLSKNSIQRNKKEFKRTDKCNSWLSRFPTKSDTSLNRLSTFIDSPLHKYHSRDYSPPFYHYPQIQQTDFHKNPIILSSNAVPTIRNEITPQLESFSQPLIMVHKKRLRRDYFLSRMQHCIQPPYSPNHFYVFDQTNMLKFQRNNYLNSKRKYPEVDNESECICSETELNQQSLSKTPMTSSPKTADHISINKYHPEFKSPTISNEKSLENLESDQSQIILSRLEKILNLCSELRTLAKDVESHLNDQSNSKTNEKNSIKKSQSEQTIIDIYQELENQQTITDANVPPNETSSMHSDHPLIQTKSSSIFNSNTTLRKAEDICSCFLKSIFDKHNCELNLHEQEYLNELTKAYLLGRDQQLIKQISPEEEIHPSPILFHDTFPKSDNYHSTISLIKNNQQQSSKYQIFFNQPIGIRTTNILPGIGNKYAQQLSQYGFSTVRRLLGFYLMIKDDQNFVSWLNNKVGISIHSAWLCTNTLRTWCQTYL